MDWQKDGKISQHYSDWCAMLRACVAGTSREGDIDFVLGRLNLHAGSFSAEDVTAASHIWPVARALGIDVRHEMQWPPLPARDLGWRARAVVGGRVLAFASWDGVSWSAEIDCEPHISVHGHPSIDSAIEHVERLFGRYPDQWPASTYEVAP